MIDTGTYDNFGKNNDYITIDESDKKHPNRVVNILEDINAVTDEYQYSIKVQWTPEKFHPWVVMDEDDLISLSEALNEFVKKIEERKK